MGGGKSWEIAKVGRWLKLGGGKSWEMAKVGRWLKLGGGKSWEVAKVGRWQKLGGGKSWEVAKVGRQRCKNIQACKQCLCKFFPRLGKICAKFYAVLSQK